ncbi:hypothetical protein SEUCBS139899_010828 [Sporothrix eucalyptigena]|uniref:Uncharacterized protein n=1 Tax=Sporothrix eucalyptigena TaxID=1812306 RepID=A0ABP0D1K6_9PEZI
MTLVSNNDTRGFSTALDTPLSYGSLGFTLKKGNGNSLADLVAGTANTSCADVPFLWPLSVVNVLNEGCKTHSPRSPGVTCAYLANNTLGVVADYDEDEPFVNMTTTGFGCAPTIDAAAAAVVESKIWNATCGHPGNITCPANFTGGPHSNLAPVAVPGLAVAMAVVMGAAAGAVLL